MESRHRRRNARVDRGASSNASHSFDLVPMPPSPGVVIRDAVLSPLRVKPSLLLQKSLYWSPKVRQGTIHCQIDRAPGVADCHVHSEAWESTKLIWRVKHATNFPITFRSGARPLMGRRAGQHIGTNITHRCRRPDDGRRLPEWLQRKLHSYRQEWNGLSAHRRHCEADRACRP